MFEIELHSWKWKMKYPLNLWETKEDLFIGSNLVGSLYQLNQNLMELISEFGTITDVAY